MGRSLLAGFAGFCAACALVMFLQLQSVNHVSNASPGRSPEIVTNSAREPLNSERPDTGPLRFASYSQAGGTTTSGTAPAPQWRIAVVRATTENSPKQATSITSKDELRFFGPQAIDIEVEIQDENGKLPETGKLPEINIQIGSDNLPAPTEKSGSPGVWQFKVDRYGEYRIWLKSKGDVPPNDATTFLFSTVPATIGIDEVRLKVKAKLTVGADDVPDTDKSETKDVYATNGPTATLTVESAFPKSGTLPGLQTVLTRNGKEQITAATSALSVLK